MKTIVLVSENIPEEVANIMYECPKGVSVYVYAIKELGKQREFKNNLKERLQALKDNPPQPVDEMRLFADEAEEEAWFDTIDMVERELDKVSARCRTLHRVCKYLYDMRH